MQDSMFKVHGQFCAAHPWEVIVGTITVTICLMSVSMFTGDPKVCGWNYQCETVDDVKSSDVLILTITKSLAVMYIYLQFKNLRKIGSKYLLGIAGLFTIFSSFIFSTAVVNLTGSDLTGLNEALPFFLLLVDLSKACALAKFALSASTGEGVKANIAEGMATLGPQMTLDALVETLAIGVGMISGVKQLETMCCFGCLSVIANYFAFMTFYPACLSLILETTTSLRSHVLNISNILEEGGESKLNPVTQRVKMIMSAGLVLVHAHARWVWSHSTDSSDMSFDDDAFRLLPDIPLWQFYVTRLTHLNVDYSIAFALACILTIKYVFWDKDLPSKTRKHDSNSTANGSASNGEVRDTENGTLSENGTTGDDKLQSKSQTSETAGAFQSKLAFEVGDSSDSESDDSRVETSDCGCQTEPVDVLSPLIKINTNTEIRSVDDCLQVFKSDIGPAALNDDEVLQLVRSKHIPAYKLESALSNPERGVSIRRQLIVPDLPNKDAIENLPFQYYDYKMVDGACAENVVGYMPVPVGVAGPLLLDGKKFTVPMATTEGCLIASTNRGCRAISASGGVSSCLLRDGMTRAPVVRLPNAIKAAEVKEFIEDTDGYNLLKLEFESTTRFGKLRSVTVAQAGRNLYIRFVCQTGDAMGMNMVSKGSEKALSKLSELYPQLEIVSLSGNYCVDKKPSAINWIEGRGKSVVCEAVIPSHVVKTVLKTTVPALVELNLQKNLIGSAMAGSVGGNNAHAANIVAAIYIACGQDAAQVVGSSNCITLMEATGPMQEDLRISCTMPAIEVGTVGGGTVLAPQSSCLQMLGIKGSCAEEPGRNAQTLAKVVCASVLAGELSLMSALAAGHLVKSHLKYNRSTSNMAAGSMMEKVFDAKKEAPK